MLAGVESESESVDGFSSFGGLVSSLPFSCFCWCCLSDLALPLWPIGRLVRGPNEGKGKCGVVSYPWVDVSCALPCSLSPPSSFLTRLGLGGAAVSCVLCFEPGWASSPGAVLVDWSCFLAADLVVVVMLIARMVDVVQRFSHLLVDGFQVLMQK